MSFLAESTDVGYYVGRVDNVLLPVANLTNTDIYPMNQHLWFVVKSALKSAGWTVTAWGSGSLTGTNSDPFTTPLSLATDGCWFIITQPSSSRSFSFQKNVSNASNFNSTSHFYSRSVRIKYSPTGFNTSGILNPIQTPGPTNSNHEIVIYGGGTDASPTFNTVFLNGPAPYPANFRIRYSVYVQTEAPYGFYVYYKQQGNAIATFFCLDPVIEATTGDPDPYVVLAQTGNGQRTPLSTTFLAGVSRQNYGFVGLSTTSPFAVGNIFHASTGQFTTLNNATTSQRVGFLTPFGEDIVALPLAYVASASSVVTGSYKGWSSFLKTNSFFSNNDGGSVLGYPHGTQTFSFYEKNDALLVGSCFIPWFGTEAEES